MSLRERRATIDPVQKRDNIHNEIKEDHKKGGKYRVTRTNQRNIMLIGRTRAGKSTIKMLLVDPTTVPSDLTLKSDTREPLFESFHINDNQMVLNIIDTPGLFEHNSAEFGVRDNETIMQTIDICVNRELTKFHVICFCVAITTGINKEDIEALKLLANFLGKEISSNSCLIVTRCESKTADKREIMRNELMEDSHFKEIANFFQLGIFFSGSINPDDYQQGNDSIYDQYFTVCDYRKQLIELFTSDDIQPFLIKDSLISEVRQTQKNLLIRDNELQQAQEKNKELEDIIQRLKKAVGNTQGEIPELIKQLEALKAVGQNRQPRRFTSCVIS